MLTIGPPIIIPGSMLAQVRAFGPATWLYVGQVMSPMFQVAPMLLVSAIAIDVSRPLQVWKVWFRETASGIWNMSVRGSGVPRPRRRSLNQAVWLVPSVMLASRTLLRL